MCECLLLFILCLSVYYYIYCLYYSCDIDVFEITKLIHICTYRFAMCHFKIANFPVLAAPEEESSMVPGHDRGDSPVSR